MRIFAFVTVFSIAAGTVGFAHAQALADVARKEQERRQTQKSGGAKVYTNGDLKSAPGPDPLAAAAPSDADVDKKADTKSEAKGDAKADAKADSKTDEKGSAKDASADG